MADLCLLLLQYLAGDCTSPAPEMPLSLGPPLQKLLLSAADQGVGLSRTITANFSVAAVEQSPQFGQSRLSSGVEISTPAQPLASLKADLTQPVALTMPLPNQLAVLPQVPTAALPTPQFSPSALQGASPHLGQPGEAHLARSRPAAPAQVRPGSGSQLYRQRQLALQAGQLYTRLSPATFADDWQQATHHPTYQDWLALLAQEARAAAFGQGQNRLEVIVGDSMGQWLPSDILPRDRLWLNQGISGDTTGGIVQRLTAFAATRPSKIHLLAGVNDLKNGVPEAEIVQNYRRILQQLQQQHPDAEIVMYSVFPTRWTAIPNPQVRSLNAQLAQVAQQAAVTYRNVHGQFQDRQGALRSELTTDGLHLNVQGYGVWRRAMLTSTI